jgi:hypothetical protein
MGAAVVPLALLAATGATVYQAKTQSDSAKASRNSMNDMATQQKAAADEQMQQMALQPKTAPQDNAAAERLKKLNSMRMGIAATMKSSQGGSAPVVAAPTLKTKLGQ